jgi:DNA-binding XRE family transcriptional regulator
MTTETPNRLTEIREREGIDRAALANAAGISERIIRRIEEVDGSPRVELKATLVTGLNSLVGSDRYQTSEVFPGWQKHRRNRRRKGARDKGGSA